MSAASPHVAVLMATYNGAEFLAEQLDSLAAQTYEKWRLWVSDDGSQDATLAILRRYQEAWGQDRLHISQGPGRGFQANFLTLTARPDISADYYAWSDQDDIWLPKKLARALERLSPLGAARPALYCGRTILTDRAGHDYSLSPLMNRRPPGFANSLVQSLAGGNTMVYNQAARELIVKGVCSSMVSHDWWAYQVVSGCGGRVFYDPEPLVRYRQHNSNLIGSNHGLKSRWSRLKRLFAGTFKRYTDQNLASLQPLSHLLTPDNRCYLENLVTLRRLSNPLRRLRRFRAAGLHRQTALQQASVYLAAFLGKI